MRIEVVYAQPDEQVIVALEVDADASVADALAQVADRPPFAQLDLANVPVGIFGEPTTREARLRAGDRVEIYRPLTSDPKEARRKRAGLGKG